MQPSRVAGRTTRMAAALAVAAVSVLGPAGPARAVEKYVGLSAGFIGQSMAIGTTGKQVPVHYGSYSVGGATLPDTVTVTVDTGAAGSAVTAAFAEPKPSGCSATGRVFTCAKRGDRQSDIEGDFTLVFTAAGTAKVGDSATVTLTVTAPGVGTKTFTQTVTVSEPGPDLRTRNVTRTTTPGGTVTVSPTYVNQGDRRAETLVLELYAEPFAELTDRFSNCHYAPQPSHAVAVCVFRDLNVEPGETITSAATLAARVRPDVPGRTFVSYNAATYSSASTPGGSWQRWPVGTGPALGWQRTRTTARDTTLDVDGTDNLGHMRITTSPNPSDVVANGASVTAGVGDTRTVKVGLTNRGPGFINGVPDSETSNPDEPYNAAVVVTFPTGVEVTRIENPAGDGHSCRGKVGGAYESEANRPGRSEYRCMRWKIGVNETHTVTFTVKITAGVTTAGSVVARGGASDPNTANNTAKIEFTGQDGLPITGVDVGLTVVVGVLLIVAGFALVLLSRPRRAGAVTG